MREIHTVISKKAGFILLCCAISAQAQAFSTLDDTANDKQFYIGAGIGRSAFHVEAVNGLNQKNDDDSVQSAYKSYFGYQITPTWGVEAGYQSYGKMSKAFSQGQYRATGDSFFIAGTAHMLRYSRFSLVGKLILSTNQLQAEKSNPKVAEFSQLTGSRTSNVSLGLGAEYDINKAWTATFDIEGAEFSKKVKGGLVTVGMKYHF